MHRIDTPDGLFSDGNPVTGELGTPVDATWLNTIQEELVAIVLAAGTPLKLDDNTQLLAALRALGLWKFRTITTSAAVEAGECVLIDTSLAPITITLPAAPNQFCRIRLIDAAGKYSLNNLVVARNGKTIMGLAEDMEVHRDHISFDLIYSGTTWRIA